MLEDYLSEPSSSSTGNGSAGDGNIKAPRNEYGNFDVPSLFPGRGVQYHLGTILETLFQSPLQPTITCSSPNTIRLYTQGSITSWTVAGATWPSRTPTSSTPPWATASSGPTTWAAP